MTIFHSSDSKIGYIEETEFGTLPTNPALQPITATSVVSKGLDTNLMMPPVLGTANLPYLLKGLQEPFIEVEFLLQNVTLPALIEQLTKSYSLVVLDDTGTSIYRIFEGCRVGALEITSRIREINLVRMAFVPQKFRDEASISGVSWDTAWSEVPLTWYNTRVELLKEVLAESPSGSGTGPYTCANSPFCDKDEDGNVDDPGDIIVYDDGTPEAAASVDSSAGTFMLSEAPAGAVTTDYIYEANLAYLIEARLRVENNFDRIAGIGLTGYTARDIREGAIAVTGEMTYSAEDAEIIDAILATTEYWGLQMKFGAGENGVFRFRAKDNFKWNTLDVPSEVDTLVTGRVVMSANNFNLW